MNEESKIQIDGLSLIAIDSILNAFDEEIYIHKIPTLIPKSIIEEKVYKLLLHLNYDFSYYFYLSINKLQYYISVKNVFDDDELLDEIIFYDLSILVLLNERVKIAIEENFTIINALKELLPGFFKLIDKYVEFYDILTMMYSNKIVDLRDAKTFIEGLFSIEFSKKLKSIKESIKKSSNEIESFNNVLDCVKKQILNKTNITLEEDIIIDSSDIYLFSIYPTFIYFSKFFIRENLTTIFLAKKLKNDGGKIDLSHLNFFYLIKYIYDMEEDWKNKYLDQMLFEKYVGLIKYSNTSLSLTPENFRFKFIKDFNKHRLERPIYNNYIKKHLSFEKKYKELKELEDKFRVFVFKLAEDMANIPSLKILIPRPDAKDEISILSKKIYNILKKDE